MIGFSVMTWFIAVIMIGLSISLLKGNYTFVHGNVFDRTKDKAEYAKKLGKPVLLLAVWNCHFWSACSCIAAGICYDDCNHLFIISGGSNDRSVLQSG